MKVLVVEDAPGRAQLLAKALDDAAPGEFEVIAGGDVRAASTLLLGIDRPPVEAIVHVLAEPDLHAVEQVRTAALRPPVVVVGPADDPEFALRCVEAGAQDHLGHPDGPALARALRHAVPRRARENALARQALHDPLTDLPNRLLFLDRVRQALSRLGRTQGCLAILFLDLDAFKQVNDEHGHAAGDALLREVAARLAGALRGGDTAARIGGDEFVVLCEDVAGEGEARTIGRRLLGELPVSASMGIALASSGDTSPEALVRDADAAMYRVKRRGGGDLELAGDGAPTGC